MKTIPGRLFFVLLFAIHGVIAALAALPSGTAATPPPPIRFGEVDYFPRWAQGDQREFTPAGQEDLARWSDMVTLLSYPKVTDGEALATTASAVLETYKKNRGIVVKTSSTPRTPAKPAEHLIVVLLPTPKFIEAVFARFKLEDGTGGAVIYSHRIHGEKTGDLMSGWLQQNGPVVEKTLLHWSPPSPATAPAK